MLYNSLMRFSDWITLKYVEWRGNAVGREKTISDFAEYIGVSQSLMSLWMKPKGGSVPRSQDSISKLIARYGVEVYDILNIATPDPLLTEITTNWGILTDEEKRKIQEIIDQSQPNAQRASAPGAAKTRPRNI